VPISDVDGQLFAAAARVLLRDGPGGLTSRAVTTEAGVAKGILHRHFADFDTFLAAFALTYVERLDQRSEALRAAAGSGTIAGNLATALTAALDPGALAVVRLILSRDGLLARLRLTTPAGVPLLAETTRMVAAYLTAERGLGRIPLQADVDRLALAIVGAAHLQLAGGDGDLDALVGALIGAAGEAATVR
jgi:AcrR family transcriptional regulator